MTRALLIFVLMSIAGCGPSQEAAAPAANEASQATANQASPTEVPSLEGSWRVTMVGGSDATPLGMIATIGGGRITLSTGCFRRAWTYTQERNMVDFTSSPSGSSNCEGQSPGADEENAYATLEGANIAIFSQGGKRADISGDSGTLTLERR